MKFYTFSLLAFATFLNLSAFAQTTGEYRSRQSGDWNDYNTWEQWDGSNWVVEYQTGVSAVSPAVETTASGIQNTDATSHSITLPSGIVVGDLLLVVFSVDNNPTVTVNTGVSGSNWTKLGQDNEGSDVTGAIFWKIAEGSDVLTLTTSSSQQSTHISYRISGGTTFEVTGTSANDDQNATNPPDHTPPTGSAPYLWIATASRNSSSIHTGAPINFSGLLTQAGGSSGASTSTATRNFTGTNQNPGTFSGGGDVEWVAYTLSVYSTEPTYTPISYPQGAGGFPVIESTATYQTNDNNTEDHSVTLPSGISANDLLIMVFRAGSSETASTPSGWTLLDSRNNNGVTYIWYKTATGGEGSTVTVTTGNGIRAAAITYRISNWDGTPEISFTGSNTNDPPSISPSWGNTTGTLFLATLTNRRSDSNVTGSPTDYSGLLTISQSSSSMTSRSRVSTAHRFLDAASENPGAFTTTGTIDNPHSATIAIQGIPFSIATILDTHTVTVTANVTVDETTIESGGELVINNGIIFTTPAGGIFSNEMGGLISGTGTLDFSDDTFTNEGTIAPGFSPGVLKIDNDFVNNGILNIEITGPPTGMGAGPGLTFDQLEIDGTAEINGTINIDFGMYVPMAGDEYQIIFSKAPGYSGMPTINVINDVIDVTYVDGLLTLLAPLPVTWLSFHAKAEGKEVFLTWSTASEQNNEGFDVQRSTNGRDWTTLGFVAGAGNSNRENHYSYTDKTISVIQPYYYRLAQMDYDGTIEYSPVRVVELSNLHQAVVNVFPNPAIDQITISFSEPTATSGTARFYDQKGRVVSEKVIAPQTNNYNTSVSELPAGMYLLEVKVGEIEWTKRIVVK